jgi:hypothetical protein
MKVNSGQSGWERTGSSASFYSSTKVKGNGAKWKQLAYRAEADRHTLNFPDGQALFTGLFDMYGGYKEMNEGLQTRGKESG